MFCFLRKDVFNENFGEIIEIRREIKFIRFGDKIEKKIYKIYWDVLFLVKK